jgi:hypothetical protein
MLGHRPSRPVGGILRGAFEGGGDQVFDPVVVDAAGPAGTWFVEHAVAPLLGEPATPPPHGTSIQTQPLCHFGIGPAVCRGENNPRTHGQTRGGGAATRPPLFGALVIRQRDLRRLRPPSCDAAQGTGTVRIPTTVRAPPASAPTPLVRPLLPPLSPPGQPRTATTQHTKSVVLSSPITSDRCACAWPPVIRNQASRWVRCR